MRLPPKPLKPTAYSRHGHWVATPLLVAPVQSKYSSDAQFHNQQWMNNQNPSLLDESRHQGLIPKVLRGPVLHFHTTHPSTSPTTAAGNSPCELFLPQSITSCDSHLSEGTVMQLTELGTRTSLMLGRHGTVESICFPPTSSIDSLLLDNKTPAFQKADFYPCSRKDRTFTLGKEILSFPSLWFFLLLSYPK